jgi:hypothetical protein
MPGKCRQAPSSTGTGKPSGNSYRLSLRVTTIPMLPRRHRGSNCGGLGALGDLIVTVIQKRESVETHRRIALCWASMKDDLFIIFPDLSSPRRIRPRRHQLTESIDRSTYILERRVAERRRSRRLRTDSNRAARMHGALRRISEIAQAECERLTRQDRLSRALQKILAIANGSTVAWAKPPEASSRSTRTRLDRW